MVFGIVILLLIIGIAYIHYVQGLLTATMSAISAIFAAVVALSYQENLINMLLKGAAANYAQSMTMVVLFALVYVILRVIFDKCIPGNIRFPLMMDKVGSAVMGIIAGLFGPGVFALAAQSLPFPASVGGYSRYTLVDRPVRIPSLGNGSQAQDSATGGEINDSMLDDRKVALDPNKASRLLIPADDLVVGLVGQLSSGALSNGHPLAEIHPDWVNEIYGQRLGIQVGANRVLLNLPSLTMVTEKGVFKLDSVPQIDAEHKTIRETPLVADNDKAPFKPGPGEMILVVRIGFDINAADSDKYVRVSPGSVRLLAKKAGSDEYRNYTPIGTLEKASVLFRNKPDDPLIVSGGKQADFVFLINQDDVFKTAPSKAGPFEIKQGVFVEVKRMARLDLSGKEVSGKPTASADVEVMRKLLDQARGLNFSAGAAPAGGAQANPAPGAPAGPIDSIAISLSDKLFTKINVNPYQGDPGDATFADGTATIHEKKFQKLTAGGTKPYKDYADGDFSMDEFSVPDGKKMVQIKAKPGRGDKWAWAEKLGSFTLVDATGNKYSPNGAIAKVSQSGNNLLVASYDADSGVSSLAKVDGTTPLDAYILFNIPTGTQITRLEFSGQSLKTENLQVH